MGSPRPRVILALFLVAGLGATALGLCDRVSLRSLLPQAPQGPRVWGAGHRDPQYGGTFVFGAGSNVRTLDPHVAYDQLSYTAIRLMFDGLLDYQDAKLVPSIAESLPEVSGDGTELVFRLRRNVRFHNGRLLTAADVDWSMHRMLNPATGSPGFPFFKKLVGVHRFREGTAARIAGIEVLDSHTIAFTLTEADQAFLNAMALTFAYPLPREHYDDRNVDAQTQPLGTGPFVLKPGGWERGVRLTFQRFERYWRPGLPYVDQMVYLENLGREVATLRFRSGELSTTNAFSLADYLWFQSAKAWQPYVAKEAEATIWGLVMNNEIPPFDNVHVRRAVAHAIHREQWNQAKAGQLRLTGQPLPPQIAGHDPQLPHEQTYDLALAKQEMALAGYPGGYPHTIALWIGEGDASRLYGELAQADLARIGLRITLKPVSFAVYLQETAKRGQVPFFFSGWNQDYPDATSFFDVLWHCGSISDTGSNNTSFYCNPELDDLLDGARRTLDPRQREQMYRRASNLVARDAPWAFIWNSTTFEAWQPYVKNYRINPVVAGDYRFVWIDGPVRKGDAKP